MDDGFMGFILLCLIAVVSFVAGRACEGSMAAKCHQGLTGARTTADSLNVVVTDDSCKFYLDQARGAK